MARRTPAPDSPLADPTGGATPAARAPRRSTADYRWTEPKVIAFLEALARCGKVAQAARAVGMSDTSAYRLRARMASAQFDAAFEGARRSGIRARVAASRARLEAARSPWEGPGLAELVARERAREGVAATQGETSAAQGGGLSAQGAAGTPQGGGFARKVPE